MLSETFQVEAIIEKPPLSWKDFKNYLKHKKKKMSIEDLVIRLRIEEDNRGSEKKWHTIPMRLRLTLWNMVKVPSSRKPTTKGKALSWDLQGESLKNRSFKGNASTVVSRVNNLWTVDCRRGTNPRKQM